MHSSKRSIALLVLGLARTSNAIQATLDSDKVLCRLYSQSFPIWGPHDPQWCTWCHPEIQSWHLLELVDSHCGQRQTAVLFSPNSPPRVGLLDLAMCVTSCVSLTYMI